MKYSLMSLIASTDIEKTDIIIFVSEAISTATIECLGGIIDSSCFIKVKENIKAFKYSIPTHPLISHYENYVMIDSDAFFLGKTNLFERIEEIYSNESEQNTVFLWKEFCESETVFWNRKRFLCNSISDEEYTKFFIDNVGQEAYDKIMNAESWWISCLTIFNKNHFRGTEYESYVLKNIWISQMCDETVFISWTYKTGIEIKDTRSLLYCSNIYNPLLTQYDCSIFHPITGYNVSNPNNEVLMNEIEKNYHEFLNSKS